MAEKGATPILATQEYIWRWGASKLSEWAIGSKNHKTHRNLILFKYDQQKSPFNEIVVQECRGLILDSDNNYRVVAYPYKKFFNYGEEEADEIDWSTAKVYAKLDGSLCTLYYYRGKWEISSSGVPDASGSLGLGKDKGDLTFAELFWEIWHKCKYRLPKDTGKCYMFEMVTPRFPIVTVPDVEELVLHGARDINSMKELDPQTIAQLNNWKCVQIYNLRNLDEVVAASKQLNPAKEEGYVVVDAKFNRVKVKSPSYVSLAHLHVKDKGGLNYRSMLDIIRTNESSEFLSYFPQWKGLYSRVKEHMEILAGQLQKIYDALPHSNPDDATWNAALSAALEKHGHAEILQRVFSDLRQNELSAASASSSSTSTPSENTSRTLMEYLKSGDLREVFLLTSFLRGDAKYLPSGSESKPAPAAQPKAHYNMGKQHKGAGPKKAPEFEPFAVTFTEEAKPFQKQTKGRKK